MQEKIPIDFVAEAEKIINDYANKSYDYKPRVIVSQKKSKNKFALNVLMCLGSALLAAILTWGLL